METVNATHQALNFEEKLTADLAMAQLQFLNAANNTQKGRTLDCPEAVPLREWTDGWKARPAVELLTNSCSDLELVKRCKELDFRAQRVLEDARVLAAKSGAPSSSRKCKVDRS